jgi:hypothetical protein
VSIVAELIGIRRHAERALPHMSWFHSARFTADASAEPAIENESSCNPSERVG